MLNKLHSIIRLFKKKIFSFIEYYEAGQYFCFEESNNAVQLRHRKKESFANILILAIGEYQESTIVLPVDKKSEATKLLKLQLKSNQLGLIRAKVESGYIANIWTIEQNLFDSARFIIPESLILEKQFNNGQQVIFPDKKRFFLHQNKLTYSSKKSNFINSSERFAMACGANFDTEINVTDEQLVSLLYNNVGRLSPNIWSTCFRVFEKRWLEGVFYRFTAPMVLVITLYAILLVGYASVKNAWLESQLSSQQSEVSELFALQTAIEDKKQQIDTLSGLLNGKKNHSRFFHAIAPILEFTRLSNIRYEQGRYLIRGEADSATQIVELLNTQAELIEVKFEQPVTQSRRRERFVISMALGDRT